MTKLPSSIRTVLVTAFLAVFAAGCDKDPAQPWHYWIAFALIASAVLIVVVVFPVMYYLKVWRLKQRGR